MNRVLMVVYNWPPRGGVGSLRALKFAKYLPRFGWEVTVLTPAEADAQIYCNEEEGRLAGVKVVKTGYRVPLLVKILSRLDLSIPDEFIGWLPYAVKDGRRVLEKEKFDLIFSISPPEAVHLIAKKLKAESGIPWIADMRDPWAEYHVSQAPFPKRWIQSIIDPNTMKYADDIITISPSLASFLTKKYKRPVKVITNGFDEEDFASLAEPASNKKFTILYAGKIHKAHQNPAAFFAAISELLKEGQLRRDEIEVHFYTFGANRPDFERIKETEDLGDILKIFPPVPYKECLARLREAHLALIIDWAGNELIGPGVLPVKVFDYMASRRPILLISGNTDSDLCRIVKKARAGIICANVNQIKEAILRHHGEHNAKGGVHIGTDENELMKFSRRKLAEELAGIFNEYMKKAQVP